MSNNVDRSYSEQDHRADVQQQTAVPSSSSQLVLQIRGKNERKRVWTSVPFSASARAWICLIFACVKAHLVSHLFAACFPTEPLSQQDHSSLFLHPILPLRAPVVFILSLEFLQIFSDLHLFASLPSHSRHSQLINSSKLYLHLGPAVFTPCYTEKIFLLKMLVPQQDSSQGLGPRPPLIA